MASGNPPYWVEQLASGLAFPSSIVWLPNGDALIAEREGGLRVLRAGTLDPRPLAGVPTSFQNAFDGIKDLVLDPDYASNQVLYLLISEGTYERRHAAVFRARYASTQLVDVVRIFRSKDEISGVGPIATRLLLLPDKTLLVGVPEDHFYKHMAQQLSSHIGKILRINRDGSIPSDNPFLSTPGALPEIWSYGHRVQTGLYRDSVTGALWEVEPGPRGGDELNSLKAGGNFGWAKATWGFEYAGALGNGGLSAPLQSGPGIEDPVLIWMPSSTPSGLARYRGSIYPQWDGDFFVGHLSGKALERLRIEERRVVLRELLLTDLEERIRDVRVGPDNYIYVLTDTPDGRLLRLQPGKPAADQITRVARKGTYVRRLSGQVLNSYNPDLKPDDPVKGKQAFLQRCAGCHSVGSSIHGGGIGPDLAGVHGRTMGAKADFGYSAAMAGSTQIWNFGTLSLLLADPTGYVPGTTMAAPPVTDAEVRRQIIAFLKQESGQ